MQVDCVKMRWMSKKNDPRTTVTLTVKAKRLLIKHRNAFGQKNVLSVGLELFDGLEAEEKIRLVSVSEQEDQLATGHVTEELKEAYDQFRSAVARVTDADYRVLSAEEQQLVDEIRLQLGPVPSAIERSPFSADAAVADDSASAGIAQEHMRKRERRQGQSRKPSA